MPLINTSVPNLIQGVSQQPDATRFDGQCEEQENALSSVANGLKKRPPMQFIGKLFDETEEISDKDSFSKALVKFIERDNNERYLVTLREGLLRIFRIESADGNVVECEINVDSTGQSYSNGYQSAQTEYLYSETSDQNVKTLTIGDTTILINTAKNVDLNYTDRTPDYMAKAVVFVKQSDYDKKYKVKIPIGISPNEATCRTGTSIASGTGAAGHDTGAGSKATSSGRIIDNLVPKVNAFTGISCSKIDDAHMEISATSTGVLDNLTVSDDLYGDGLGLVYKEADSISDLPVVCVNGLVVKVVGDVELNQDDYYVKFETVDKTAVSGKGSWVETVAPDLPYKIDVNTPMKLANTGPNAFTLYPMPLGERTVGDDNSNPSPSFIGAPISNVFLFKRRLGFLSEDAVILSEAGFGGTVGSPFLPTTRQSFNFFRTTVTTLLDSDPIDVRVSNRDVTTLRAAQPFQEDLLLFSDSAQFKLSGGDLLTPKTISINQVTSFDYNKSVEPLPLGAYLYFPFDRGAYSGIREYNVNATTSTFDSEEITQHVPQYVPRGLTSFTGSNAENLIALSSGDITYTDGEPFFANVPEPVEFAPFEDWAQVGDDIDGDAAGDRSGYSVSMNAAGNIVAIGGYAADGSDGTDGAGQVKVYQKNGSTWTQIGDTIEGTETTEYSGHSVSMNAAGDRVAIGSLFLETTKTTYYAATGPNNNATSITTIVKTGGVRVYQNIAGTWTQLGPTFYGDVDEGHFGEAGYSVSMNAAGDRVAIGAPKSSLNKGSFIIAQYDAELGSWAGMHSWRDGESNGDQFGTSVSLNAAGDTVAVGARYNDGNGSDSGHVKVYQWAQDENNQTYLLTQIGNDIDGEAVGDQSGFSVSLNATGDVVAIGAIYNSGNGTHSGHVRVYKNISGTWTQLGTDIDGEAVSDQSGYSVSMNDAGSVVAIGARRADHTGGYNAGHVRVYYYINDAWTLFGNDIDGETSYDGSGFSVSLNAVGDRVAIGAPDNGENGMWSGHVRVYGDATAL